MEAALHSEEPSGSATKERLITAFVLLVVALLTTLDIIEDNADGAPWSHLLIEAIVVLSATFGAMYLVHKVTKHFKYQNRVLQIDVLAARQDAQRWRKEASTLLAGLGEAIEDQFDLWQLSAAEKEVGILLLKGLSHKEIAAIRNTNEKTVRQQSTSLYAKASLDGRAQLSAFFLEELLLPISGTDSKVTPANLASNVPKIHTDS